MKTIFGLCGIPRAGNTLFASVMNQNPDVSVTANSPLCDILGNVLLTQGIEAYQNYPDEKSLANVVENITQNYYQDWDKKYIIDRSTWGYPNNLSMFKQYVNSEPKIIVLVRDIVEVLASFVKFSYSNDTNYIAKNGKTLEQRCDLIMQEGGALDKWLRAVYQLTNTPNKKYTHLVEYDDLVKDPKSEIEKIYDFLGIPRFEHNFENIPQLTNNGISYDDSVLGGDLHKIRTDKIEKSDYTVEDIMPESLINRFNKMNFWDNKKPRHGI